MLLGVHNKITIKTKQSLVIFAARDIIIIDIKIYSKTFYARKKNIKIIMSSRNFIANHFMETLRAN